MTIAANKFPFIIEYNEINIPVFLENNEDYKNDFNKRIVSKSILKQKISFSICIAEFETFYNYLIIDLDLTKNLFYIDIQVLSKINTYLADIVSYPKVVYKNGFFDISFDLVIINNI